MIIVNQEWLEEQNKIIRKGGNIRIAQQNPSFSITKKQIVSFSLISKGNADNSSFPSTVIYFEVLKANDRFRRDDYVLIYFYYGLQEFQYGGVYKIANVEKRSNGLVNRYALTDVFGIDASSYSIDTYYEKGSNYDANGVRFDTKSLFEKIGGNRYSLNQDYTDYTGQILSATTTYKEALQYLANYVGKTLISAKRPNQNYGYECVNIFDNVSNGYVIKNEWQYEKPEIEEEPTISAYNVCLTKVKLEVNAKADVLEVQNLTPLEITEIDIGINTYYEARKNSSETGYTVWIAEDKLKISAGSNPPDTAHIYMYKGTPHVEIWQTYNVPNVSGGFKVINVNNPLNSIVSWGGGGSNSNIIAKLLTDINQNRTLYSVNFRIDPRLQLFDIVKMELPDGTNEMGVIEELRIEYNGAFNGFAKMRALRNYREPLTIKNLTNEQATISIYADNSGQQYNFEYENEGINRWHSLTYSGGYDPETITIPAHGTLCLRGNNSTLYRLTIGCDKDFELSGNLLSLYAKQGVSRDIPENDAFERMFANTNVVKISKDFLNFTSLKNQCFSHTFENCTKLLNTPDFPNVELKQYCYSGMFSGCTSLTKMPLLPSTLLAENCYSGMFGYCTSLVETTPLNATQLARSCYSSMFKGCTSLIKAPDLPATTLAVSCYIEMFQNCTSLENCPTLPASVMQEYCYLGMFSYCTSIIEPPSLQSINLESECYRQMFMGCTNLEKLPSLPATTLKGQCYSEMFSGCTKIKISAIQVDDYLSEYRVPIVNIATNSPYRATYNMFANTGGAFTSTPNINTTYYTSNEVMDCPKPLMIERVIVDIENYHFTFKNTSGYPQTLVFHITSDIEPTFDLEDGEIIEINEENAPQDIYYAVRSWLNTSMQDSLYCYFEDMGFNTLVLEEND